jgi:hypothetical protein
VSSFRFRLARFVVVAAVALGLSIAIEGRFYAGLLLLLAVLSATFVLTERGRRPRP